MQLLPKQALTLSGGQRLEIRKNFLQSDAQWPLSNLITGIANNQKADSESL